MSKFIGVKMVEAVPMTAEDAIKNHYIVSAFSSEKDGYEVTYNDGYKSWCPKSIFEHTYFEIKFDDKLSPEDIMLLKKLKTKFGLVLDLFFNGLLMV